MNRFNRQLWQRFWAIAKPYWFSNEKWSARGLLAILLVLALVASGLSVLLSFMNRNLINALEQKNIESFYRSVWIFVGVIVVAIPLVVFFNYIQKKLSLYWRRWLTNQFLNEYFQNRAYYQINSDPNVDNPDQRISEDINSFTKVSLDFLLIVLTSVTTLIGFIGVLGSISLTLVIVLVVYAIAGTVITVLIGKRLIGLNFNQLRKEADFRYGLVHVRDHAESIAFYQGEAQEFEEVKQRFNEAYRNFDRVIAWERNLSFFTTGYNYAIALLPFVVLAPAYFAGQIQLGVVIQAGIAFSQVLSALSVIVSRFEQLSAFAAGVNRLALFDWTLDTASKTLKEGATVIDTVVDSKLALKHITLNTPNYQKILVRDLSVALSPKEGLLIVGQSGCGKSSLLRAIAGLWNAGTGCIIRPKLEEMLFLPQRPYMVLGSLRSQLLYPNTNREILEDKLYLVLQQVNLTDLPERVGGLDAELDWANILSLGEQQRLAFARLLLTQPRYAILDEATSALDSQNEDRLYRQLNKTATTFISVGHRASLVQYHQYVLALTGDTTWQLLPAQSYTFSA
ncbi:ABC transporter ATP-binding protein (plasmid) [Scytonema sp. HK-05]|uniref:ABC transporter ATP-binding protein/permease n=1 Tax=Scytonema sp. HK-05 TaxID=1137095 RepID=UPI000935E404|nr:ABC transporter ATP-binding protein/permease [Scytonema sp. HK-05]OKH58170.1 ABC transporter ATP-binding protein [Scytonema sp. HK-05]BAY50530.1 ABC transporter ATP-binding protein [Scytonema sp. HK-05]